MAHGPIISRPIVGEKAEAETDFLSWGSKSTVDSDCSHETRRRLLLGRKAMANLDSMLESRDYFANKCPSSQGYGFSISHL